MTERMSRCSCSQQHYGDGYHTKNCAIRTLPQEDEDCPFTSKELRDIGDISVKLGQLHWQAEELGDQVKQISLLVDQHERLSQIMVRVLLRQYRNTI